MTTGWVTFGSFVTTLASEFGGVDAITTGSGADVVLGGSAGDSIASGAGRDLVLGDNGSYDFGTTFSSSEQAVGGDDAITTAAGDDIVIAGFGADTVDAGDGADVVLGDNGSVTFGSFATTSDPGFGGTDLITTGAGDDVVFGGSAADRISSGAGRDLVLGDNGRYEFGTFSTSSDPAVGGDDLIDTADGDDVVIAGAGADTVDAGEGDNLVVGDNGSVTFGSFVTTLAPEFGGADAITTGSGADAVLGGSAGDLIVTGAGRDLILGDNGRYEFGTSLTSSDPAVGGDDLIDTADGDDVVIAGFGADAVDAGEDDNIVVGDNGAITFGALVTTLAADLGGADAITTGSGNDIVLGGAAGDQIATGAGRDLVLGDNGSYDFGDTFTSSEPAIGGDDAITTSAGDDVVIAGFGADTVDAGDGDDVVVGDNGAIDLLGFRDRPRRPRSAGHDAITDRRRRRRRLRRRFGRLDHDRRRFATSCSATTAADTSPRPHRRRPDPAIGGIDAIIRRDGDDVVIGGAGADERRRRRRRRPRGRRQRHRRLRHARPPRRHPTSVATDAITTGIGTDIVLGGAAGDSIATGAGDDLVLGDNGSLRLRAPRRASRIQRSAGDDRSRPPTATTS